MVTADPNDPTKLMTLPFLPAEIMNHLGPEFLAILGQPVENGENGEAAPVLTHEGVGEMHGEAVVESVEVQAEGHVNGDEPAKKKSKPSLVSGSEDSETPSESPVKPRGRKVRK